MSAPTTTLSDVIHCDLVAASTVFRRRAMDRIPATGRREEAP